MKILVDFYFLHQYRTKLFVASLMKEEKLVMSGR